MIEVEIPNRLVKPSSDHSSAVSAKPIRPWPDISAH